MGELGCQLGPVSCLVRLPTGLNICELVWTHKGVFEASDLVHQGQFRQHNFGGQLLILAFDIDLFFVTILSWLTRKQH